ncbi:hypothetical protein NLJ89_g7635 [Agrocybe chaxingu]|uniref:NAD-dependent epimerase/dehydratase domain-containing protein n=1 Tax=Agrocybe chaxingu TaxID=84603 RepID=A0A9W8JYT5_9AGAR|nr:hypothetical protein NLJ89_g7635 [Agrocybe chaxingu]
MSGKLILVTGATGFIAGQVIDHALEAGYRVRGTVRTAKLDKLKAVTVPGLEFVEVNDIVTADLTEALNGTDIVIHVAAPLPSKATVEDSLKIAMEGPLNVVRQAEKVGITKIIVTSTFGALMDPSLVPAFTGKTFRDFDWGATSKEEILDRDTDIFYCYFGGKNLGERALWNFAREHPHLDITTILPGFVYGPYAKILPKPSSLDEMGTNTFPYMVANGLIPPFGPPFVVDGRDVGSAHINAIDLPPSSDIGSKRFIVNAGNYSWKELAAHLQKVRPELNVPPQEAFADFPGPLSTLDGSKAQQVLRIKEYISPVKTMEDIIDDLEYTKAWTG